MLPLRCRLSALRRGPVRADTYQSSGTDGCRGRREGRAGRGVCAEGYPATFGGIQRARSGFDRFLSTSKLHGPAVTLGSPLARFAPSQLPPYRLGAGNESMGFSESLNGRWLDAEEKGSRCREP